MCSGVGLVPVLARHPRFMVRRSVRIRVGAWPGVAILIVLLGFIGWPHAPWNRHLVLVGAAMVYLGCALTLGAALDSSPKENGPKQRLIYEYASRYHLVSLLGLAVVMAALFFLATNPQGRFQTWPAAVLGTVAGLLAFVAVAERSTPIGPVRHPDQKACMSALHRIGQVATKKGVAADRQFDRIFTPSVRSLEPEHSDLGPLRLLNVMWLIEVPQKPARPKSDDEARDLVQTCLTRSERLALGDGACAYLRPGHPGSQAQTIAVARVVELNQIQESKPGHYHSDQPSGRLTFEFPAVAGPHYLELPGLETDQELVILRRDKHGDWRPRENLRWAKTSGAGRGAVIDLEGLIHWRGETITQFAIQLTRAGEISLQEPPRLIR